MRCFRLVLALEEEEDEEEEEEDQEDEDFDEFDKVVEESKVRRMAFPLLLISSPAFDLSSVLILCVGLDWGRTHSPLHQARA